MTLIDWGILAFAFFVALIGYERGFIVAAFALAGFAAGAWIGTRLAPVLLPEGSSSPYAPLVGLFAAVFLGIVVAVGFHGVGSRLREVLRLPGLHLLDGILGALLALTIGLGVVWLGGAALLHTPGLDELRLDLRRSIVLDRLNSALPPSGPILNVLARLDPLPRLPGGDQQIPVPSAGSAHSVAVNVARGSVVRIYGTACGLGIQGSGWIAAPGLVVTNAHVVAGEQDTTVELNGRSPGLPSEVVRFDAHNDIAVLRVAGLSRQALQLDSPKRFAAVAILGYPHNGPFDARAGRIGTATTVRSQDAYGDGPILRKMVELRGVVQSGNSGGPVVDSRGHVVATVFAALTGSGPAGGYAVPNSVVERDLNQATHVVSSGSCA